jgi:uncharacterized membrane protein
MKKICCIVILIVLIMGLLPSCSNKLGSDKDKVSNKEIINRVVKEYFETGHLSERILKNNRDVKEDRLLKIYKNNGDIK